LALNIQIELLDHPLFEIAVLGLNSSCVTAGIHGRCKNARRGTCGVAGSGLLEAVRKTALGASEGIAETGGKKAGGQQYIRIIIGIQFRIVRGILPQSLATLVPGGIVEDRISATDRSLVASHWFPREAEARFQSGLVELDADSPIRSNANRATPDARAAFWDEPLQARDIEIRLPETPRGPLLFSVRNPDVLYLRGMLQKPAAFSLLPVEPI
jgi:hypothetical protein